MDIQELTGKMLSGDTLKSLGKLTGSTQKDVKGVLTAALPALLEGAKDQANDSSTAEGFVGALADHAKDDTRDLSSFISGVDLADGGKILGHLLGSKVDGTASAAAASAGVTPTKAGNILSGAAPLLLSLLGQQTASGDNAASNNASGIGGLMGSLLSNVDLGSLLGSVLGGGSSSDDASASSTGKKKKKKTSSKKEEGGFLNTILGLFRG